MTPGARASARAPVLYPAPLCDPVAARDRLVVDAGRLVLRRPGGDEVVAAAGDVRAAFVVPNYTRVGRGRLPVDVHPWVVVELTSGRPLALPIGGWLPGTPLAHGDRSQLTGGADPLDVSGIRALLGAAGLPNAADFDLDEPAPQVLAELARPRQLDPRAPDAPVVSTLITVARLTAVVAVVAWTAHGIANRIRDGAVAADLPWPPIAAVLTVAATLLVTGWWARYGRQRWRSDRDGGAPVGSTEMVPLGSGGVQVGRDDAGDLVVVGAGRYGWLPGASAGGVVEATALVANDQALLVSLRTVGGTPLAELPGVDTESTQRLRRLLATCGVDWVERRAPRGAPAALPTHPGPDRPIEDPWPGLCQLVATLAALAGLAAAANQWWLLTAAAGVIVAACLFLRRSGRSTTS